MPKRKLKHPAKQLRAATVPSMHYSIIIALVISNITSLGLAFLMAQMLGVSMGNIVLIGAEQGANKANAQVISSGSKQNPVSSGYSLPMSSCETRWAICSQVCDDDYADNLLTAGGWNRCEKDCDLRLLTCNASGQWVEDIKVRDTKFKT